MHRLRFSLRTTLFAVTMVALICAVAHEYRYRAALYRIEAAVAETVQSDRTELAEFELLKRMLLATPLLRKHDRERLLSEVEHAAQDARFLHRDEPMIRSCY